jgi:hypothetical protein
MAWRYGARARLTRRQFVAGSAAGLAALGAGLGVASRRAEAASPDVLVVGGGVGGVAAALAALRLGKSVILTEETDWIGGQLTAQAVPPDENPWIESTGCTASYRQFRNDVRAYYRAKYALRKTPYNAQYLNPGMGTVSALCHEPLVALAVLTATLQPYQASGKLTILLKHRPKSATLGSPSTKVESITLTDLVNGGDVTITAPHILDATELGDLLPMVGTYGTDYVTGAESQLDQGTANQEYHALTTAAEPLDQQAISWCFPLEFVPGGKYTIAKPAQYNFWSTYAPRFWLGNKLLGWTDVDPQDPTLSRTRNLFDGPTSRDWAGDMWHFRRIFWHDQCLFGLYPSDLTLVNWPQIDYWINPQTGKGDPLVGPGVTDQARQNALNNAKQLSLSMLYWMQTEAPRFGGGFGYPELRLRPDVVGTSDGLAKVAYIRESRRIKAKFPIYEKYIGVKERELRGLSRSAEPFLDSVGIGYYRIDLHPSTGGTVKPNGRTYVDVDSYRFQVPLGALIPDRLTNLLPAAKNIGTTHVTNGCYRLHPVEWTIGEAAGALAAYCLDKLNQGTVVTPAQVRNNGNPAQSPLLAEFQQQYLIGKLGFVLAWPQVTGQEEYPDGRRYGGGG